MKKYRSTYRYFIYLFCNGKKQRLFYRSARKPTILNAWEELRTQKPPRFLKTNTGKKRTQTHFELGLLFPKRLNNKRIYKKDELGRNVEVVFDDEKLSLRELIPYWCEEFIYDYDYKMRIRYDHLLKLLLDTSEICQIFKLNNKIILQIDDNFRLFSCKNVPDAERLFELLREDILEKKRGNFIFIKDIVTQQRNALYKLLEEKGYKHSELLKHYSY